MKVEHKDKKIQNESSSEPKSAVNIEYDDFEKVQLSSKDMFWSGKLNALAPRLVTLLRSFFLFLLSFKEGKSFICL
jgi:hypothetical protein